MTNQFNISNIKGDINKPTLLNVGCHDIHIADFINIDINPEMKPDLIWDALKLREKFADSSVDFIYCGHFMEHLTLSEGLKIAQDFKMLLKPYGSIVVVIPDYSKTNDLSIDEAERIILGAGEHKTLYNVERLLEVFTKANFETVISIDVEKLQWCRFNKVKWQSAILAINNDKITFTTG